MVGLIEGSEKRSQPWKKNRLNDRRQMMMGHSIQLLRVGRNVSVGVCSAVWGLMLIGVS